MSKKRDTRQIEAVARLHGIIPKGFGKYIEECKGHGDHGSLNDKGGFTWDELCEKAEEFKRQ